MESLENDPLPFWFDGKRPGATEEELNHAERYVGNDLPAKLRELLREQDGGVSNYAGYVKGELYLPFLPVFGVRAGPATGTIMRAFDVRNEFGVPQGVVPFAGQGHSWWGLDYRSDLRDPCVVFRGSEEEEIVVAAESFDEFVDGLIEE